MGPKQGAGRRLARDNWAVVWVSGNGLFGNISRGRRRLAGLGVQSHRMSRAGGGWRGHQKLRWGPGPPRLPRSGGHGALALPEATFPSLAPSCRRSVFPDCFSWGPNGVWGREQCISGSSQRPGIHSPLCCLSQFALMNLYCLTRKMDSVLCCFKDEGKQCVCRWLGGSLECPINGVLSIPRF